VRVLEEEDHAVVLAPPADHRGGDAVARVVREPQARLEPRRLGEVPETELAEAREVAASDGTHVRCAGSVLGALKVDVHLDRGYATFPTFARGPLRCERAVSALGRAPANRPAAGCGGHDRGGHDRGGLRPGAYQPMRTPIPLRRQPRMKLAPP
jgi:hypothetical protein